MLPTSLHRLSGVLVREGLADGPATDDFLVGPLMFTVLVKSLSDDEVVGSGGVGIVGEGISIHIFGDFLGYQNQVYHTVFASVGLGR